MLDTLNANPGLTALASALVLFALLLLALLLLEREHLRAARRERRVLLERLQRESERQAHTISLLNQSLAASAQQVTELSSAMEARQDRLRATLDARLDGLQRSNDEKLELMRQTVSEKLETSLEGRLSESFKVVNQQLAQVHRGLGEMQSLAASVGDLRKVLTNVKTRGVWGEVRLRALLEETLIPGQYVENAQADPASQERVEFALVLPAQEGDGPLLPIDSKFPQEDYLRLVNAQEAGDAAQVEKCGQQLERAVLEQAKRVSDKYIRPPRTTDFAILFLPFEGLYAEAVNRGMVEELQKRYKVNLAGPSTMAALLNSLQMGFRTLAIEKRSSEVWEILRSVRTEFDKFGDVLEASQRHLQQVSGDLDQLVGVRTRQIQSKLKNVEKLEDGQ